jgi:hypothetical protein
MHVGEFLRVHAVTLNPSLALRKRALLRQRKPLSKLHRSIRRCRRSTFDPGFIDACEPFCAM